MIALLIAAATLADTTGISSMNGSPDAGDVQEVVVEGRRSDRDWEMPKLEYDEPAICPAFVEAEIPGFGALRIRRSCATDRTEEWRLFQR